MGRVSQGADSLEAFVSSLQKLGLAGLKTTLMLRTDQYQLLQIDTPTVPPEELRAAARYQIKDMLQVHVDDVTLDVVAVGDGKYQSKPLSFVVAATNAAVKSGMDLAQAMDWQVSVIDVQDMAQRNLQSALARAEGPAERAHGALVLVPGQQALLTLCAHEELFYARRFDLSDDFLTGDWGEGVVPLTPEANAYTPVEEYVPAYASAEDLSYREYTPGSKPQTAGPARGASESAQRLVVEVQRSLDVWDRSWSALPLHQLRVYAGRRSEELARWLGVQLGHTVTAMDVSPLFTGLEATDEAILAQCWPLLGVLLRSEGGGK
jgi:MSHA biogenesis protein MshI